MGEDERGFSRAGATSYLESRARIIKRPFEKSFEPLAPALPLLAGFRGGQVGLKD